MKTPLNVTRTILPSLAEYTRYLEGIWESSWITNNGPLAQSLESNLRDYLDVGNVVLVNNGTIALQVAIKSLGLEGKEVITTPFSYVATASSLAWEGCTPVFADIDSETLTLDPKLVEKLITPKTAGILATHVYGNPCDVDTFELLGKRYGLKVFYDAAHSFGVKYKGEALTKFGDCSILSFHATKLFHSCEGGALVTQNADVAHRASYMRNFGHDGPEAFCGLGINGKISELHAAMGLCMLPRVQHEIERRREISKFYDEELVYKLEGLRRPTIRAGTDYNFSYYPVVLPSEEALLNIREEMNGIGVFPRRYFYPCLSSLPYVENFDTPLSRDISRRVLCLPLFSQLTTEETERVIFSFKRGYSKFLEKAKTSRFDNTIR